MIKQRWPGLAALAWANGAIACSCMGIDNAGFVHTAAKRLPANARGALFLPPSGAFEYLGQAGSNASFYTGEMEKLSPSSFRITSDAHPGRLAAELSWPDASRGGEASDATRLFRFARKADEARAGKLKPADIAPLLQDGTLIDITKATGVARRLVRVGPVGGFKPGARYKIAYLGKAKRWRFPAVVEHAIDMTALDTKGVAYGLALDGPPMTKLLPQVTYSGSCSSNEPALVQDFHYVLPKGHAPYQDALIFASEFRAQTPAGTGYARIDYIPSLCPVEPFMSTAYPGGRDLIHAQCTASPAPAIVRGWAGMLEVEDHLHPTDTIRVDLRQAAGGSCTGFGILKDAIASGSKARIKQAACSLEREYSRSRLTVSLPGFPNARLLDLFSAADPELQKCARTAAARLFDETSALHGEDLARYAATIRADLRSSDPAMVGLAAEGLSDLAHRGSRVNELLPDLLDAVVEALIANREPRTERLPGLLAPVKDKATRHVPRLLAVSASKDAGAENAMMALAVLIPDDSRLHRLLVANAGRPALRERSALVYSRVAGKVHPDQAIAMLIASARAGGWESLDALSGYGRRARAAVPMLVQLLRAPADIGWHGAVVGTLIDVSDGDPAALKAVGDMLNDPAKQGLSDYNFAGLGTIGENGRALLPAFETRMRRPVSPDLKKIMAQSIATMRLPAAQRDDLLARLENAPVMIDKDEE